MNTAKKNWVNALNATHSSKPNVAKQTLTATANPSPETWKERKKAKDNLTRSSSWVSERRCKCGKSGVYKGYNKKNDVWKCAACYKRTQQLGMRIVKLLLHMETVEEWEFSDSKQNERTFVDKRGRMYVVTFRMDKRMEAPTSIRWTNPFDDKGENYIYLGDANYERK